MEFATERARHRAATLFRHDGLLEFLRSRRHLWHELEASKFLMDRFDGDLCEGRIHDALRRPLLDYYLTTDTTAWRALAIAFATLTDLLAKLEDAGADGRPAENFDRLRTAALEEVTVLAKRAAHETLLAHKLKVARGHLKTSASKKRSLGSDRSGSVDSIRRAVSARFPRTSPAPLSPLQVRPHA